MSQSNIYCSFVSQTYELSLSEFNGGGCLRLSGDFQFKNPLFLSPHHPNFSLS